jgi:DNA transformation protein
MAQRSEFVDYIVEQLALLGEVDARWMFGGYGIFHKDRMFALVADDTLYFKTDDESRVEFEQAGLSRFRPGSTKAEMPYFQAPAQAIDDRDLLCHWAEKGIAAAERTKTKKRRR